MKNEMNFIAREPEATGFAKATPKDFEHCVDISGRDIYVLVVNGKADTLKEISALESLVNSKKTEILKRPFNIITDSSTPYQKTVDVLDIMTKGKIMDYKMLMK